MKPSVSPIDITPPTVVISSPNGATWLEVVNQQVSALRFGTVEITVHEGRVVQIETSVKVRFDKTTDSVKKSAGHG